MGVYVWRGGLGLQLSPALLAARKCGVQAAVEVEIGRPWC